MSQPAPSLLEPAQRQSVVAEDRQIIPTEKRGSDGRISTSSWQVGQEVWAQYVDGHFYHASIEMILADNRFRITFLGYSEKAEADGDTLVLYAGEGSNPGLNNVKSIKAESDETHTSLCVAEEDATVYSTTDTTMHNTDTTTITASKSIEATISGNSVPLSGENTTAVEKASPQPPPLPQLPPLPLSPSPQLPPQLPDAGVCDAAPAAKSIEESTTQPADETKSPDQLESSSKFRRQRTSNLRKSLNLV